MNEIIESLSGQACSLLLAAGFFRYLGLVAVFPFPDGQLHPGSRIGIALALTLARIESPLSAAAAGDGLVSFSVLGSAMEFLQGLLCGLPLLLVHHGVRMWGDLFESLRGHQIGLVIDPLSGGEEPPLALMIAHMSFAVLLAQTTLPLLFITALQLGDSLPAGLPALETLGQTATASLQSAVTILQSFFFLLMPYVLIVFLVEIVVALLGRVVQGLALSSEGYLLRLILTLLFLMYQADYLTSSFVRLVGPVV